MVSFGDSDKHTRFQVDELSVVDKVSRSPPSSLIMMSALEGNFIKSIVRFKVLQHTIHVVVQLALSFAGDSVAFPFESETTVGGNVGINFDFGFARSTGSDHNSLGDSSKTSSAPVGKASLNLEIRVLRFGQEEVTIALTVACPLVEGFVVRVFVETFIKDE